MCRSSAAEINPLPSLSNTLNASRISSSESVSLEPRRPTSTRRSGAPTRSVRTSIGPSPSKRSEMARPPPAQAQAEDAAEGARHEHADRGRAREAHLHWQGHAVQVELQAPRRPEVEVRADPRGRAADVGEEGPRAGPLGQGGGVQRGVEAVPRRRARGHLEAPGAALARAREEALRGAHDQAAPGSGPGAAGGPPPRAQAPGPVAVLPEQAQPPRHEELLPLTP